MSRLQFKVSEFQTASDKATAAAGSMAMVTGNVANANRGVNSKQKGKWADASYTAGCQLEADARVYSQAISRLKTCFADLVSEGTNVQTARTTFLSYLGASPTDNDLVVCEIDADVTGPCSASVESLVALMDAVQEAQDALSRLKMGTNGIEGPLSSIVDTATQVENKVTSTQNNWAQMKSAAEGFESTFSNTDIEASPSSFASSGLITQTMIDSASVAMQDLDKLDVNGYFKGFQSKADALKKLLDLRKGVLWSQSNNDILKKMPDPTGLEYWGKFLSEFKPGDDGVVRAFTLNVGKGKFHTWLSKFLEKSNKDINFAAGMDDTASNINSGIDDMIDGADDTIKYLGGTGKYWKGLAKGASVVGDVISIGDSVYKGVEAYNNTSGDTYDKTAAAIVTTGKGVAQWGVGKLAGAAIGACFGGPVGAMAGAAIGGLVQVGINALWDAADDHFGWSENAKKALANNMRNDANNARAEYQAYAASYGY